MSPAINLNDLPKPTVIESLNYEEILAAMLDDFRNRTPEFTAVVESDPAYKILEVAAYREMILRQRINDAARSVMLAYATGTDLEHIAARFNVKRLVVQIGDANAIPPIPPRYESDDALRRRTQLSLERLALAGTQNSYIFETLSAHPNIRDASAVSKHPGEVTITVLTHDESGIADVQTLNAVTEHLNQETVRTLTDKLSVQTGKVQQYSIKACIFSPQVPESELCLKKAKARAQLYTTEQFALGKNIRLSAIASALHVDGVQHVVIEYPEKDLVLDPETAGQCLTIDITHAGADH